MKCTFPNQTRDAVEYLWHGEILRRFPLYGKFWEEFIGVRVKPGGYLSNYEVNLANIPVPKRDECGRILELICMTHYSCFCQLAGAHRMYEEMNASLRISASRERHFRHWQAMESSLLHLGAAWQELKLLWQCVIVRLANQDEKRDSREDKNAVWTYFDKPSLKLEKSQLDDMQHNVIDFRNEVAHFSRPASQIHSGVYQVPKNPWKGLVWSQMMSIRDWEDTSVKLNHSIAKCEDTFNSLHSHLIHNLSQLLSTQGITIDYSTGENDRFCKKCNWWMKPAGSAATQPGSGSVDYVTAASGIHPAAATGKAGSVSRIYHECVNCGSIEE